MSLGHNQANDYKSYDTVYKGTYKSITWHLLTGVIKVIKV